MEPSPYPESQAQDFYLQPWFIASVVIITLTLTLLFLDSARDALGLSAFDVLAGGSCLLAAAWFITGIYRTKPDHYSVYVLDAPYRDSLPRDMPIALNFENGLQPEYDTTGWRFRTPFFRQRIMVQIPDGPAGEKIYIFAPFGKNPTSPYLSGQDIAWEEVFVKNVNWDTVKNNLKNLTRGIQRRIFFGGGIIMSLPPYVMAVTRTYVYYYNMAAPEYLAIAESNGKPRLEVLGLTEENFKSQKVLAKQAEVTIGNVKQTATIRRALQVTVKEGPIWQGKSLEESGLWWPALNSDRVKKMLENVPKDKRRLTVLPEEPGDDGHILPPTEEDMFMLSRLLDTPNAPIGDLDRCIMGWQPDNWDSTDELLEMEEQKKDRVAKIHRGPMARLFLESEYVFNSKYVDAVEVDLPATDQNEVAVIQCLIGPPDPTPYKDGMVHVLYRGIWKSVLEPGQIWPFSRDCFNLYKLFTGIIELSWEEHEDGTLNLSKTWKPFRVATVEGFEAETEGINVVPFVHVRISRSKAAYVVMRYGEGAKSGLEILQNLANRLKSVVEEAFRTWVAKKKVNTQLLGDATTMRKDFFDYLKKILEGKESPMPDKKPEDYGVILIISGIRFVNWPDTYMKMLREKTYAGVQKDIYDQQTIAQAALKTLNEAKATADMATMRKRASLYSEANKVITEILTSRGEAIKDLLKSTGLKISSSHVITFVRQLFLDDLMFVQVGQGGIPLSRVIGMISGNTAAQPLVSQFLAGGGDKEISMLAGVLKVALDDLTTAVQEKIPEIKELQQPLPPKPETDTPKPK